MSSIGELIDAPQLLGRAREGQGGKLRAGRRGQRAFGARDRDPVVRRTRISARIRDGSDHPLLLGLQHGRREAHAGIRRPARRDVRGFLIGDRRSGLRFRWRTGGRRATADDAAARRSAAALPESTDG
jgi:hypothetical protein